MKIAKADVPYSLLVSSRELQVGDRLASDCFGKNGRKVAGKGDRVDKDLIRRLRNMKVRKAWVQRTLPEWMPPSEAQLFQFEVTEEHDVSPLHYQILMNFQGTFSTHGIDELLDLLRDHGENIDFNVREDLSSIREEFDRLKPREEKLRQKIDGIDSDELKDAYRKLLSAARPQAIDPSQIKGGQAAIGRRVQSFLESLQQINNRLSDIILKLNEKTLESLVELRDVDQYEDTSNFLDSFVLFERLYQQPTIDPDAQVQSLFNNAESFYRTMFYEREFDQQLIDQISELLWADFDPDLPHWIMSLGQGGKPNGYLMAHSVNTAILVSQLYRRSDRDPLCDPRAITTACLLMDIGMVLVPQSFHLHRDEMTEEQEKKTRIHPYISKDFYYSITNNQNDVNKLIEKHHEQIDGSGYPKGISDLNRDITLINTCDMFEAMSSPRMWRSAMPPTKIFKILREDAGTSLDKTWVHELIRHVGIYPVGSMVRLSNDQPAVVIKHNKSDPARPSVIPVNKLMKSGGNGTIDLDSSDLSIQTGGTSIKAPDGIRKKLLQK